MLFHASKSHNGGVSWTKLKPGSRSSIQVPHMETESQGLGPSSVDLLATLSKELDLKRSSQDLNHCTIHRLLRLHIFLTFC